MASVRKRVWISSTGEKQAAWQVDYRDSAGRRRSKQFARKKEAEAWLSKASWEVLQGVHTPDSQSATVEHAARLWLDSVRANGREATTIAAYDQHVRLHIVPLCGARKLSQLTAPQVKVLLDQWLAKLSRAMATRVFRSFKAILSDAQERGLVAQNVGLAVKMKKAPRERGQVTLPTKQELRSIIAAAENTGSRALALVSVAVFAGLRASEIRGLNWSAVDLKEGLLNVVQRADAKGQIGSPKSRAGFRTIPVPSRAIAALRAWKLACPSCDDDLVFPTAKGKPMSHRTMTVAIVDPVQIIAGVVSDPKKRKAKFGMHAFRHAAASLWIEQGLNPKRIQVLMGHSSIQVTFDTYGHLFEQARRDAEVAQAIEQAIFMDAT